MARRMVALREAWKAFRVFGAECFWSYNREAKIGFEDIDWVVEGLKKDGDRRAFEWARRIQAIARK